MPPFISIDGLTKRFGDHLVIDRLNLTIERGEVVVFQGPSGIGKSTLLRCLTYLEPFQSGDIRVGPILLQGGQRDVDSASTLALRKQVGFVFQFFNLFPHLSVLNNITLGPVRVLGESEETARAEAMELLKRVGLVHKADTFPHALSGGQQQRIGIARALAMRPQGILFDEPTSSLDPAMKEEIVHVMEDFAHDQLTMLIVTHEVALMKGLASRLITLKEHCQIESDEPLRSRTEIGTLDAR